MDTQTKTQETLSLFQYRFIFPGFSRRKFLNSLPLFIILVQVGILTSYMKTNNGRISVHKEATEYGIAFTSFFLY